MSKGTVQGKPTATHGTVKVVIADDNQWRVAPDALLSFAPKPNIPVGDGDYIEFTITSVQSCDLTKKILSTGVVREIYANGSGRLMVMTVNPNPYKVAKNDDLTFNNLSGVTLRIDDNVQFINLSGPTPGSLGTCDVVSKI